MVGGLERRKRHGEGAALLWHVDSLNRLLVAFGEDFSAAAEGTSCGYPGERALRGVAGVEIVAGVRAVAGSASATTISTACCLTRRTFPPWYSKMSRIARRGWNRAISSLMMKSSASRRKPQTRTSS